MDSELVKVNISIEHHSISVWVMVLILVVLFFVLMFWRMLVLDKLKNDDQHKQKTKRSILFVRVGVLCGLALLLIYNWQVPNILYGGQKAQLQSKVMRNFNQISRQELHLRKWLQNAQVVYTQQLGQISKEKLDQLQSEIRQKQLQLNQADMDLNGLTNLSQKLHLKVQPDDQHITDKKLVDKVQQKQILKALLKD